MKSARWNSVAFTWLHGGHQTAPQYRNTGLPAARAPAKARSTSASEPPGCHAIAWALVVAAGGTACAIGAHRANATIKGPINRFRANVSHIEGLPVAHCRGMRDDELVDQRAKPLCGRFVLELARPDEREIERNQRPSLE